MVFSSHIFLFYFLPLTLLLYSAAPRSWRMPVLTACSYVFYGWTNPWFCVLLAWSTTVDFICGNFIAGHWRLRGQPANELGPSGFLRAPRFQRRLFVALSLISNLGMLEVRSFSAVINPPQVGILAVGAVERSPVETATGGVAFRDTTTLTLTSDHRVVYGADAARFLRRLRELLEHPLALVL